MHSVVLVLGYVEDVTVEKIVANLPSPCGFSSIEYIATTSGFCIPFVTSPATYERRFAYEVAHEFVTESTDVEALVYQADLGGVTSLSLRPRLVREAVYDRQRHFNVSFASVFAVGSNEYVQRRW